MSAGAEALAGVGPPSPRADVVRRVAALGVIAVVVADLLLLLSGSPSLCSDCGQVENHGGKLVLGLAGWAGYVLSERRLAPLPRGAYLGALTGTHVALASYLVALPRWCTTCVLACALSVVALVATNGREREFRAALAALGVAVVVTHVLLAR